ncbi:hypothetical protein MUGA111182_10445 [Mucilaginibacter galii]
MKENPLITLRTFKQVQKWSRNSDFILDNITDL